MDPLALLHTLSARTRSEPFSSCAAELQAFDICLSLINARTALPQTAQWFLETRQAPGTPDPSQDFWMSRVSAEGAAELQALVPRLLVLYAISRYNDLVGNSGAGWTYCALAILPEPPDEDLERQTLETLFQKVVSTESAGDLRPFWLCPRVLDDAPPHTILRVQYAREMPDVRSGHEVVQVEIDGETAIDYWPALDADFNNFDQDDLLSKACETLGLSAVSPMQLGAFLSAVSSANADQTESWGGSEGLFAFEEGNIPFLMKTFAEEETA